MREASFVDYANYMAIIKNAVKYSAGMLSQIFCRDLKTGEIFDAARNGNLICAFFASCPLLYAGKIKTAHATVAGLEADLQCSGWIEVSDQSIIDFFVGSVVIWEPKIGTDGEKHRHIGFYLGERTCVSTDPISGRVIKHDVQFIFHRNGKRGVESVYWHPFLAQEEKKKVTSIPLTKKEMGDFNLLFD